MSYILMRHIGRDMTNQLIGYARTSTVDQAASFEHQRRELERAGCTKVFSEQVSAVSADRPELTAALEYVREGDVLIATRLDRIARSVRDLSEIVETLKSKGVGLRILGTPIDTTSATGELMLNMLGAFSQFERSLLLERQKIGIEKAKADGRYKGRKPTAMEKRDEVMGLVSQGVPKTEIARRVGIGRASVYRIIKGMQDVSEATEEAS